MATLTTIVHIQPLPALCEPAILKQRQLYLLATLELCGRSMSQEAFHAVCEELAEIETTLQRYGGTMEAEGYPTGPETRRDLGI